tara:strand:- start:1594 stop:2070 length:477 start_codon:yes stop_codon:yes gene_type:complete
MTSKKIVWSLDFARTGASANGARENIKGIAFNVEISPFRIPLQIRVSADPDSGRMTIMFDYPTGEPERLTCDHEDDHAVIYVGETSRRVQRIEVRVDDTDGRAIFDRVKINLAAAADHVDKEKAHAPLDIQDNYDVVAQSLRSEAMLNSLVKPGAGSD